jgi:hypothetical protein
MFGEVLCLILLSQFGIPFENLEMERCSNKQINEAARTVED